VIEVETGGEKNGVQAQNGVGTPFQFHPAHCAAAIGPLQYREAVAVVSGFARGPLGRDRVAARQPLADRAAIDHDLRPVAQLLALWQRGEKVDVPPVPDITAALSRLRVEGSVLSGPELVGLRQTLVAGRIAHGELRRLVSQAPALEPFLAPLPDKAIEQRLHQSLDDEGELLDTASPRLFQARQAIHQARERLVKKLETVLRTLESQAVPSGAQVTVRGDRYVIPVRRDSRSRPDGIIHDESASHGTLFVEPLAAIEHGNALRTAIADAEREALRVLRELTEQVRSALDLIGGLHEMCVAGDDLVARVRYAHAVGGAVPKMGAAAVRLVGARHPLLIARGLEVVPFDLRLDPHERTLLISGPNAGGKTVLLKTVGLVFLMAQAGIVPPVGAGTELPVFTAAFADIGDHQSIAADLSTFSAHLAVLREVLSSADRHTLVLMDEIGSGTDPAEGGALAAAALRRLTALGAFTVATTHLGVLKTLASEVPGVVNGSLDFDAEQLRPTFRFRQGVPGRSYGLAIARRLAVDPIVVAEAESAVPDRERALDDLLAQVEERARALEGEAARVADRLLDVENREARTTLLAESQAAIEKELHRRERELEREGRRESRRYLLEARERVEAAIASAKEAADPARARELRRGLENAVRVETDALAAAEREDPTEPSGAPLMVGQRVRLAQGGTGTIREIRGDGKLVVTLGALKVVVEPATAVAIAGPAPSPERPRSGADLADHTGASEIDLRGMRADEAAQVTLAALDAAILAEHPWLRIIHGMGTGAVRDRVRQVLKGDRRVAKFDFAPRNQGGTGVTVVEFKDAS
jgi:DNA mismatch repair protein MutS2